MTINRIGKFYVTLNGINDVAYFGFVVLQFLLLEPTLRALLPDAKASMSTGLSMTLITSQLLFQILAEGPTGAAADTYGRARAVAMSFWCRFVAITLVVACAIAGLNSNSSRLAVSAVLAALVLAQIAMATGEAFLEGSIEAWLCDECKTTDPENYQVLINRTFEYSAVVQNIAILLSVTTVLLVWQFFGKSGGIALAATASILCLAGAVISHKLSSHETFTDRTYRDPRYGLKSLATAERLRVHRLIMFKMRDAFTIVRSNETPVRRLITTLFLPFPCWIILSWFFTGFAHLSGPAETTSLSESYALGLGITLGVARVIGASVGKWLGRRSDLENLKSVFEKAIFVNVSSLFGAAALLVLRMSVESSFPSSAVLAPFLLSVALAKGSEEVIKLSKNKFLAATVPNSAIRATILSFVSVAQNAFAFVTISLGALLAIWFTAAGARQPVIVFAACASIGITGWLGYSANNPLRTIISWRWRRLLAAPER